MEGFDFLSESQWQPLAELGFVHSFFNIDRTTIMNTWFIILIIGLIGLFSRYIFLNEKNIPYCSIHLLRLSKLSMI